MARSVLKSELKETHLLQKGNKGCHNVFCHHVVTDFKSSTSTQISGKKKKKDKCFGSDILLSRNVSKNMYTIFLLYRLWYILF